MVRLINYSILVLCAQVLVGSDSKVWNCTISNGTLQVNVWNLPPAAETLGNLPTASQRTCLKTFQIWKNMYWFSQHTLKKYCFVFWSFLCTFYQHFLTKATRISSLSTDYAAARKVQLNMLKCAVLEIREVINGARLLSWRRNLWSKMTISKWAEY